MVDAHQSKHWTCEEIDCHKDGSPINQIMAAVAYTAAQLKRHGLRERIDEIENAKRVVTSHWTSEEMLRGFNERIAYYEGRIADVRVQLAALDPDKPQGESEHTSTPQAPRNDIKAAQSLGQLPGAPTTLEERA